MNAATIETLKNNMARLDKVIENIKSTEVRQLATMNKIRRMSGKVEVSSFDEHRKLKAIGQ